MGGCDRPHLQHLFGPLGTGISLVAIVCAGLLYAFGEGGSKSQIAGLIFGIGMVIGAVKFLEWIGVENVACTSATGGFRTS